MYGRFFITGLPRTGTGWLMSMLDSITGVTCYGESKLFSGQSEECPALYESIKTGIDQWARFIACRRHNVFDSDDAIKTIGHENYVHGFILDAVVQDMTTLLMRAAVRDLLPNDGPGIYGDKTPMFYPDELDNLLRTVPSALVIILQRNVYNWVRSWALFYYQRRIDRAAEWRYACFDDEDFYRIHRYLNNKSARLLTPKTLTNLVNIWHEFQSHADTLADRKNIITYKYEQMQSDPKPLLRQFAEAMQIEISEAEIDDVVNRYPPIKKDIPPLSDNEMQIIETALKGRESCPGQ